MLYLNRWGALVLQGCGEDQPTEIKLMSAEVLVKAIPTLLMTPALPLGEYILGQGKVCRNLKLMLFLAVCVLVCMVVCVFSRYHTHYGAMEGPVYIITG